MDTLNDLHYMKNRISDAIQALQMDPPDYRNALQALQFVLATVPAVRALVDDIVARGPHD